MPICFCGKWLIFDAFLPEGDHHDGKFTRDGGDGFFLGGFASAGGEFEAILADGAIGAVTTEQVLGALGEEGAEVFVAGFADGELFVAAAGLVAAGHEAEVGTDVSWVFEAARIFDTQYKNHGGDGTDGGDFLECHGLGMVLAGGLLDDFFVVFDLVGEGFDGLERGGDGIGQFGVDGEECFGSVVECLGAGRGDAQAQGFEDTTNGGDDVDALAHE